MEASIELLEKCCEIMALKGSSLSSFKVKRFSGALNLFVIFIEVKYVPLASKYNH